MVVCAYALYDSYTYIEKTGEYYLFIWGCWVISLVFIIVGLVLFVMFVRVSKNGLYYLFGCLRVVYDIEIDKLVPAIF